MKNNTYNDTAAIIMGTADELSQSFNSPLISKAKLLNPSRWATTISAATPMEPQRAAISSRGE